LGGAQAGRQYGNESGAGSQSEDYAPARHVGRSSAEAVGANEGEVGSKEKGGQDGVSASSASATCTADPGVQPDPELRLYCKQISARLHLGKQQRSSVRSLIRNNF
jgi:hypothetical protein